MSIPPWGGIAAALVAVAVAQNVYSALGRNSGCGDSRRTPLAAVAVAPYLLSALGRNGGGWRFVGGLNVKLDTARGKSYGGTL